MTAPHGRAVTWHPAAGGIRRVVVLEEALLVDPANYARGMRARVGGQLWGRHQRMHVGGGKARV